MSISISGSGGITGATTSYSFDQSVSIGGTLTYEDVTNIDSVGVITAQSGIRVTGGALVIGGTDSSAKLNVFGGDIQIGTGLTFKSSSSNGNLNLQGGYTYPGGWIKLSGGSSDDNIVFGTSSNNAIKEERLRIDSSGRLLINTNSSTTVWGYGDGSLQLMGDYQGASASFINNEANTNSHAITLAKTRNGSILQNGDTFGAIVFSGDDSNGYHAAARIIANVDGTPSDNVMPGRLSFQTGGTGGGSPTERLRITSGGFVGINETSPGAQLTVKRANTATSGLSGVLKLKPG